MDQSNAFMKNVFTPASFVAISNQISKATGKAFTKPEVATLKQYMMDSAKQNWTNKSVSDIQTIIVKNYLARYHTVSGIMSNRNEPLDIKELLSQQLGKNDEEPTIDYVDTDGYAQPKPLPPGAIANPPQIIDNVNKFLGISELKTIVSMFNQPAAKTTYVTLDSRNKSADADGISQFAWSATIGPTSSVGSFNIPAPVQNIVSARLYPMRIPYKEIITDNAYKRISVFVQEWSGQAYFGPEGRKYHFMCNMIVDDNMIVLDPLPHHTGEFKFNKPISSLTTLTLSFGMPFDIIQFDSDNATMAVTYSNPAVFTMISGDHNLLTGELVYFTGFTTIAPVADAAIINSVNNASGHNITTINDTSFSIPIDLSAVTGSTNISAYFGSKRIIANMELIHSE